jgi:hypothetical protein
MRKARKQNDSLYMDVNGSKTPVWMFSWQHVLPTGRRVRRRGKLGHLTSSRQKLQRNGQCEVGGWPSTPIRYTHSVESQ